MSKSNGIDVAVVGVTGAVGLELLKILPQFINIRKLNLFASARSAGLKISCGDFGELTILEYSVEKVRESSIVFLAVSGEFALENAKLICENNGPFVVDNSSAFRYENDVPLIIPEINFSSIGSSRLIANPNCTTAIAAMALWPIHQKYKIKKLIIATYQAASGAGAEGMEELIKGTEAKLKNIDFENKVFAHPLPFNLIPHIDKFVENNYTKEEMKVVLETLKIFGESDDKIKISCTAVRIPILRAHSEAISIETEQTIACEDVKTLLKSSRGVRLVDDPSQKLYPMPSTASNSFDVEVGRIRDSLVFSPYGIDLFVCGDQLLRGAALNAVLIAVKLIENEFLAHS